MIEAQGLTKRFGRLTAVDQVTLDVHPGEICSILGPNGAGKSTLISILTGLARADQGTVRVAGLPPSDETLEFRRRIGVVPESLALLPELTIEEHLALSGPLYGLSRLATRERSEELLQLLDLAAKRRTFARECSHGMRKKTALAMALLHNPQVVILDEPFEGIDPVSVETIRAVLTGAARHGLTVLLTSHILSLVDRVSDRVLLIRDGRVVRDIRGEDLRASNAEAIYFETVERPDVRELEWLRASR
jgi:ABC-2 type transport system ATP-binding protein